MHTYKNSSHRRLFVLVGLQITVLLLLLFALAPRLGSTSRVLDAVARADWPYIALSFVLYISMYLWSAVAHGALLPKSYSFRGLVAAQFAGGFASRILPNGFGGSSFLVWHYHNTRQSWGKAVAIIVINNALGWVANTFFLLAFLPLIAAEELEVRLPDNFGTGLTIAAIVALATACIATVVVLGGYIGKVQRIFRQFTASFRLFSRTPKALVLCLAANAGISLWHALSLWAALQSTGLSINPFEALYVLSVGVLAGSAVPIPGGIGSVEAGLLGSLAVLGLPFDTALSGVLIYRSITIWSPIVIGYPLFIRFTAKK